MVFSIILGGYCVTKYTMAFHVSVNTYTFKFTLL